MDKLSAKEVYNNNELFKHYVDKFASTRGITVETALTYEIMRMYAQYLGETIDEDEK